MRKILIGMAIGFQLLVLLFMAGEREWVMKKGEVIYFRTRPVDPRDPFRGDYVRLDYEVNHIHTNYVAMGLLSGDVQLERGRKVYAELKRDEDGLGIVKKLTGDKPPEGLFVKGRTDYVYSGSPFVAVKYGIEAYFVQQGEGKKIEAGRVRGEVRVPLDMEVAVGRGGMAVLKNYRWCPLGIGLKVENTTNRQVRAVTVTLVNVSSNVLAVIDPSTSGWLRLESDSRQNWGPNEWMWTGKDLPVVTPVDGDVILLNPGEEKSVHIDLTQPSWFVRKANESPRSIGELRDFAGFRFVYQAPDRLACAKLRNAGVIWHGTLSSQAFTSAGRWD